MFRSKGVTSNWISKTVVLHFEIHTQSLNQLRNSHAGAFSATTGHTKEISLPKIVNS